jgi:hypothetical protein
MTKLSVKEILAKVDKLIASGRYTQTTAVLRRNECERCYLGLVTQVLVDEGYYNWGYDTTFNKYILIATEKGIAAGYRKRHDTVSLSPHGDFPLTIKYEGESIAVWRLNDDHKLSFKEINAVVKAAVAKYLPSIEAK